MFTLPVDLR